MALTVEDGTGLAAADTYITEADADVYVAAYEPEGKATWDAALSAAKEVALRKATQWLDATYVERWKGVRINETMALDWPRSGVVSRDAILDSDAVPVQIEQATTEAAVRFLSGELTADVSAGTSDITGERSELGPLKEAITYAGSKSTQDRVPKIDSLIRTLVFGDGRFALA